MLLVLSRRNLRKEEKVLRALIDDWSEGKKGETTSGIDELIRLVVEHRAVRAQRMLTWLLRGWIVPHVAIAASALILLALHVFAVSR
jgi:hypothetical protein